MSGSLPTQRRRHPPLQVVLSAVALCACLLLGACSTPRGEFVVSAYAGRSVTEDADIELRRPSGTKLDFDSVAFDDDSFESPYYWGARGTYWFRGQPCWGVSLDYTHVKVTADTTQVTRVEGVDQGVPIDAEVPIGNHLDAFSMTHGFNLLTLNVMRRWFLRGRRDHSILGRLQPYVGLGAGIAVPHAEVSVGGDVTSEYQVAGPAIQAQAGLNIDILGPVSAFLEYKINYAPVEIDLEGGGTLSVDPITHHFVAGLSVRF